MIDPNKKSLVDIGTRQIKSCLNSWQKSRLESITARSFSDDADIRDGALSAPRSRYRPGQRDDTLRPAFVGLRPVLY
jgi:hypothetical protein